MAATLSVVVPVYGTKRDLPACLESLRTQSLRDAEFLLVDDASPDGAGAVLAEYARRDSRFRVLTHSQNRGLFAARMTGADAATGKYLAFLDSDDFVSVDFYRAAVALAEENDFDLVMGDTVWQRENGDRFVRPVHADCVLEDELRGNAVRDAFFQQAMTCYSFHTIWNKVIRRDLWLRCAPYYAPLAKKHIVMTEDIAFSVVLYFFAQGFGRHRGDGVFYPNIYVNDIPLQGKTLDEAAALVTQQVQSLISSFKITLRTQDGRSWDITGDSLNMQYNVADQLDQLWAIGHTGSSSVRYEQVKALEEEPAMRYTTLSYDMSQVNQILSQIKSEVDLPAVNATRVDDETKWPPFSYTDETAGQTLDITGLNERICTMVNMLESGVVDLTPVPVQPSVTRAQLEAQIVKLSSFETTVGKTGDYVESRTENIRVGTERFNRLTVAPGKSVSFNKVALKRTAANGYQVALEIAYGNYVEGIGGGICQVSSTLYNAVVNAGLTVNKRTPHAIPSSYVDKGKDATVSDDRYDFVFTNNTGANIYIETQFVKVKGYWTSRFIIYGRPDPNGYTYKLDSQVVETIPLPEPTYKKDKNGEYVIYDDETYQVSKGREGYVVDVYLVTMDSNGLEISREKKYTDTYKAAAPIYYVGVTPRETPMPDVPSID